ncbi:MAG: HDOD domain-containing protein [Candidatus Schekmanbacteria bacterium]|nr:HDOD domain-containing protein [Candidatus Schekmanbacteria bacterium]
MSRAAAFTPADLAANTDHLPAMPAVAAKAMELIADPETTLAELQKVIEVDAALATEMLRISNTALYSRARVVSSLRDAIVRLGFKKVRSVLVTVATQSLFRGARKAIAGADVLWQHSVLAGLAARQVAQDLGSALRVDAEEAFLGALLHDVGKVVMLARFPDEYGEVLRRVWEGAGTYLETEAAVLGVDHRHVGHQLLKFWGLPVPFQTVALFHHEPDAAATEDAAHLALVSIVGAISTCLHLWGLGSPPKYATRAVDAPADRAIAALGALGVTPPAAESLRQMLTDSGTGIGKGLF